MKVSGVGCQVSGKGDVSHLYETTPKWHVFLVIRLAAAMAWIKQRTAEYRITNNEFRRMESLRSVSLLKKIEYTPSTFIIDKFIKSRLKDWIPAFAGMTPVISI